MAGGYKNIVVIEDKESAVKLDEESRLGLTRFINTFPCNQRQCLRAVANRLHAMSELKHSLLAAGCACLGGLSCEDWRRSGKKNCGEEIKLSKIISPIQLFYAILQSDCKIA